MIDCIAERRYTETKPQRTDVRPAARKYSATIIDLESIDGLVRQWHKEIGTRSSPRDILDLPISKRIMAYGVRALPAVIRDLYREPSLLVLMASEISEIDPVAPEIRGNIKKMSEAWVSWYLKETL